MTPVYTSASTRVQLLAMTPPAAGAAKAGSGTGWPLALQQGGGACPLVRLVADAQVPARAPPSRICILVVSTACNLDSTILCVIFAGGWELEVLARSIGRLCPMLGSFNDDLVPTLNVFGLAAVNLQVSW
jgi:hypothetical protein